MNGYVIHERIVQLWRNAHPHVIPPLRHACSRSSCNVVRIGGFACSACGVHLGARALCQLCRPIQNSYICMQTGFDHLCGSACTAPTMRSGLCTISGQSVSRGAVNASTHLPVHARARNRRHLPSNWLHTLVQKLLFSSARVRFEKHRRSQLRVSAERAVHRHRRQCNQEQRAAVYLDMALIYMRRFQRCKPLRHLQLPRQRQQAVCERYAKMLRNIMRVLGQRESEPTAIVLLYLMRNGCSVRDSALLPPDLFLARSLPDAHSLTAILGAPTNFTSTKNQIQMQLREQLTETDMKSLREVFV